ncbi:16S rRNA C1402 (ribose-2'-O) methylase RsmI [Bradyrhizobium sp. S3.2.6]|uniref:hypothetical protein n=1 Tax=Bradyrhizobium sp. S3.2.6 TaxID=3156428 RepID=UPI00339AB62F
MTVYWLTFRIHEATVGGRTYEKRYEALNDAVRTNCTQWWKDPTSFIAFESASTIKSLINALAGAVAESHDMFLIREMDTKSAGIYGKIVDQDIFKLMPYLQKYS